MKMIPIWHVLSLKFLSFHLVKVSLGQLVRLVTNVFMKFGSVSQGTVSTCFLSCVELQCLHLSNELLSNAFMTMVYTLYQMTAKLPGMPVLACKKCTC